MLVPLACVADPVHTGSLHGHASSRLPAFEEASAGRVRQAGTV